MSSRQHLGASSLIYILFLSRPVYAWAKPRSQHIVEFGRFQILLLLKPDNAICERLYEVTCIQIPLLIEFAFAFAGSSPSTVLLHPVSHAWEQLSGAGLGSCQHNMDSSSVLAPSSKARSP